MKSLLAAALITWALLISPAQAQPAPVVTNWTYHASKPEAHPCPEHTDTCNAWRRFREAHPWPYQAYAIARRDDRVIAIISEPPPQLSRAELEQLARAAFGAQLEAVTRFRWATGIDGWLEDLVLTLRPASEQASSTVLGPGLSTWEAPANVVEALKYIDLTLHGTADGFWLENIDQPVASSAIESLSIRSGEAASWLGGDGSWTVLGGEPASGFNWSAMTARQGAYRSADDTLVALVLPRNATVVTGRGDFRRFALESDLLVAAVRTPGKSLVLLGRKRQQPLSDLPPLRFETFAALAAARTDELAQSYERQRVFAGKILTGDFGGWDWAPILLSRQLEDSEFGTLLNQADQLLKSWSQAGEVRYLNFPVRHPDHFPFDDQPLSAIASSTLDAPSVLFNWNTRGFSALADGPVGLVLAPDRAGVLPILYLPLGEDGEEVAGKTMVSAAWSETGRRFFEEAGHPLVTRVAQNTFLYQAVLNLLTARDTPADTTPSRTEIVTSAIQAEARTWLSSVDAGTEPGVQHAAIQQEVRSLLATPGMTLDKAAELLATSQLSASRLTQLFVQASELAEEAESLRIDATEKRAAYRSAYDEACAEALRIGGTKTPTGCEVNTTPERQARFARLKRIAVTRQEEYSAANTAANQAVSEANSAYVAYQREARSYGRAQRLGREIADSAWLAADLDAIKDRVLAAAAGDDTAGAIRTPSLVLSQNQVESWAVGGHNVGGRVPVGRRPPAARNAAQPNGEVEAPRPAVEALQVRPDAPRSMLELVRSRPVIAEGDMQRALARLQACGECRAVVERVGADDFVVARRPPAAGQLQAVRGASGLIDVLREARTGEMTQFYGVDARWARALSDSVVVGDLSRPQPSSLFERARVLFSDRGRDRLAQPPHTVIDAAYSGELGGRRTVSIFGDDPARIARTARAKPAWAQATVEPAKADPLSWIEANPEVNALRGPRDTHPTVVVVVFPRTGQINQLTAVVEMAEANAAAASGARLQAIIEEARRAMPTADVATMAARTRDRIREELDPDDVNFYVRDNLGDLRMALLDR